VFFNQIPLILPDANIMKITAMTHSQNHDDQLIGHANGRDNRIEGKDDIEEHDLMRTPAKEEAVRSK